MDCLTKYLNCKKESVAGCYNYSKNYYSELLCMLSVTFLAFYRVSLGLVMSFFHNKTALSFHL